MRSHLHIQFLYTVCTDATLRLLVNLIVSIHQNCIMAITVIVRLKVCGPVQVQKYYNDLCTTIIRTVVRIVGMGRMSHICNTKCSRL